MFRNLGAEVYQTWDDARRREEIGRLVEGSRSGLPVEILCAMATAIAGSQKKARKVLSSFMSLEERQDVAARGAQEPESRKLVRSVLL